MIESTYSCLLRLRTYEGVDLLYKRKILTRLQYHKKLEGKMSVLKFLSVPCCWSWLTVLRHLLCHLSHHWLSQSSLCVYLYMFPYSVPSRIFITSPYLILISWYPSYSARVVCTQGLPLTLFWRKNSAPPIRWIIDEVRAWSVSWKQFSKI